MKFASLAARCCLALVLWEFSLQQFLYGHFCVVILPVWPGWLPGEKYVVYAVSVVMIAAGIGLPAKRPHKLSLSLGWAFLGLFILGLPHYLPTAYNTMGPWTAALKTVSLAGCAWVIAGGRPVASGENGFEAIGRVCISIFLVFCGIEHFVYTDFCAGIIPDWIPWHYPWTYIAGVGLIGGGLGILPRIKLRIVALLAAIMIFLWVPLLHIPRAIADPTSGNGNECNSVVEALVISITVFLLWTRQRSPTAGRRG